MVVAWLHFAAAVVVVVFWVKNKSQLSFTLKRTRIVEK